MLERAVWAVDAVYGALPTPLTHLATGAWLRNHRPRWETR